MREDSPIIIAPENPGTDTIDAPVLKVFDGDGFLTQLRMCQMTGNPTDRAEFEAVVRFGFIDAPELEQPGGYEAKDFLTSLIGRQRVQLVVLTKMDTGRSVDSYGRIVCVPFLTHGYSGGEFKTPSNRLHKAKVFGSPMVVARNIELEMVLNGWAWVLERYGPDERYFDALADARRHKRGIWAREGNIHPWEFKKQKFRKKRASRSPDLLANLECPMKTCGGHMVKRSGRHGAFLGCSNFPKCRHSRSLEA